MELFSIVGSTLSFDAHISYIPKSTNFHLRSIDHIRKYFTNHITKQLINVLVLSRIDYCRSLFSNLKKNLTFSELNLKNIEVKKIDRIIRSSIHLIYNINRREHFKTDEHQHNLKWLLFRKRFKTDEHQHNLKWLLFRKRCKHRLLCLALRYKFLGKSDYLYT